MLTAADTAELVTALFAGIAGSILTAILGSFALARSAVRANDAELRALDARLEDWLVSADRDLERELKTRSVQSAARGQGYSGSHKSTLAAARTETLYAFRTELRSVRQQEARIHASEGLPHRIARLLRTPPTIETPDRATPLLTFWKLGTEGNQLDWSLADITTELAERRADWERKQKLLGH